jgi:AcrR family transcriptional regulator
MTSPKDKPVGGFRYHVQQKKALGRKPMSANDHGKTKEERMSRILEAGLEVLTEYTYEDATTVEIASRARMSKRDLYAFFPNKQALLMGVILRELQLQERGLRDIIQRTERLRSLRSKLELMGISLVDDVLSPRMGVVRRLVIAESFRQPFLGNLFFEGEVKQRCMLISEVLATHLKVLTAAKRAEFDRAAEQYFSMVVYLPTTMMGIGMQAEWTKERIGKHVSAATETFLRANSNFV